MLLPYCHSLDKKSVRLLHISDMTNQRDHGTPLGTSAYSKQGLGPRTADLHVTPFRKTRENAVYCTVTATDLITNNHTSYLLLLFHTSLGLILHKS